VGVNPKLQAFVYGIALAALLGWVLYIGRPVFVPIVLAALVVYVILGLMRIFASLPRVGRLLSPTARFWLSILVSLAVLAWIALVIVGNLDRLAAAIPLYQASLLASIQKLALRFGIEHEPTWGTLRQVLFDQVSVQSLVGSTVASATAILGSTVVVFLYVVFLLVEQRHLQHKIDRMATDPANAARLHGIVVSINARVGSYLALKTFVGFLLGAVSWAVMAWFGLELAVFWALMIALLNYVPYLGSFLGVLLPTALALVQFPEFGTVLALLAALSAVQFVIGNFLDPYLLGNSLNLSPFAILASLAVWSGLWGIPGAFLAVPITAVLTIVFSEFPGTRPVAILLSRSGDLS
jgi:AI-2 transport protein TqsA